MGADWRRLKRTAIFHALLKRVLIEQRHAIFCCVVLISVLSSPHSLSAENEGLVYWKLRDAVELHPQIYIKNCASFFQDKLREEKAKATFCADTENPQRVPVYAEIYPEQQGATPESYAGNFRFFDQELNLLPSQKVLRNENGLDDKVAVSWVKVFFEYYDPESDQIQSGTGWVNNRSFDREDRLVAVRRPGRTPLTSRVESWRAAGARPEDLGMIHAGLTIGDAESSEAEKTPGEKPGFWRRLWDPTSTPEGAANRQRRLKQEAEAARYLLSSPMGTVPTPEAWRLLFRDLKRAWFRDGDEFDESDASGEIDGELGKIEDGAVHGPQLLVEPTDAKSVALVAANELPQLPDILEAMAEIDRVRFVCARLPQSADPKLGALASAIDKALIQATRDSLVQEFSGECVRYSQIEGERNAHIRQKMQALLTTNAGKERLQAMLKEAATKPDSARVIVRDAIREYLLADGQMPYYPYRDAIGYDQYIFSHWEKIRPRVEAALQETDGAISCLGRPMRLEDMRAIDGLARTLYGEGRGCEGVGEGHFHAIAKVIDDRLQATVSDTDAFARVYAGQSDAAEIRALRTEPGFFTRIINESALNAGTQFQFTRLTSGGDGDESVVSTLREVEKIFAKPGQFSVLNTASHEVALRDILGRENFEDGKLFAAFSGEQSLQRLLGVEPILASKLKNIFAATTIDMRRPRRDLRNVLEIKCKASEHERELFASTVSLATEMVCEPRKFREHYPWRFHREDLPGKKVFVTNADTSLGENGKHELDWLLFYSHGFQLEPPQRGTCPDRETAAQMRAVDRPEGDRWSCCSYNARGACAVWARSIKPGMLGKDFEVDITNFGPNQGYHWEKQKQGSACPEPHYWYPAE